jgi:hypothetical protein
MAPAFARSLARRLGREVVVQVQTDDASEPMVSEARASHDGTSL